ncbi:hypothetical protein HDV05_003457 [Chytridiales sp. JEL 0842]|nr:hypothetical protein HDV05_003457 [Chytridiales sp. JEL 0842]
MIAKRLPLLLISTLMLSTASLVLVQAQLLERPQDINMTPCTQDQKKRVCVQSIQHEETDITFNPTTRMMAADFHFTVYLSARNWSPTKNVGIRIQLVKGSAVWNDIAAVYDGNNLAMNREQWVLRFKIGRREFPPEATIVETMGKCWFAGWGSDQIPINPLTASWDNKGNTNYAIYPSDQLRIPMERARIVGSDSGNSNPTPPPPPNGGGNPPPPSGGGTTLPGGGTVPTLPSEGLPIENGEGGVASPTQPGSGGATLITPPLGTGIRPPTTNPNSNNTNPNSNSNSESGSTNTPNNNSNNNNNNNLNDPTSGSSNQVMGSSSGSSLLIPMVVLFLVISVAGFGFFIFYARRRRQSKDSKDAPSDYQNRTLPPSSPLAENYTTNLVAGVIPLGIAAGGSVVSDMEKPEEAYMTGLEYRHLHLPYSAFTEPPPQPLPKNNNNMDTESIVPPSVLSHALRVEDQIVEEREEGEEWRRRKVGMSDVGSMHFVVYPDLPAQMPRRSLIFARNTPAAGTAVAAAGAGVTPAAVVEDEVDTVPGSIEVPTTQIETTSSYNLETPNDEPQQQEPHQQLSDEQPTVSSLHQTFSTPPTQDSQKSFHTPPESSPPPPPLQSLPSNIPSEEDENDDDYEEEAPKPEDFSIFGTSTYERSGGAQGGEKGCAATLNTSTHVGGGVGMRKSTETMVRVCIHEEDEGGRDAVGGDLEKEEERVKGGRGDVWFPWMMGGGETEDDVSEANV